LLLLIGANASTAIQLQRARESREHEERLTRWCCSPAHPRFKDAAHVISGYSSSCSTRQARGAREYAELALKQFEHIVAMQRDVLEFARGEKSILIRRCISQSSSPTCASSWQTRLRGSASSS